MIRRAIGRLLLWFIDPITKEREEACYLEWKNRIGPDVVKRAIERARKMFPDAELRPDKPESERPS